MEETVLSVPVKNVMYVKSEIEKVLSSTCLDDSRAQALALVSCLPGFVEEAKNSNEFMEWVANCLNSMFSEKFRDKSDSTCEKKDSNEQS
jgi:hypothetical protein